MSVEDAVKFMRKVQEDPAFREGLISIVGKVPNRSHLLAKTENGIPDDSHDEDIQKYALPAWRYISNAGFSFTRDELYSVIGEPPTLSPEDEERLLAMDVKCRRQGLEGVNAMVFTVYSAGLCK